MQGGHAGGGAHRHGDYGVVGAIDGGELRVLAAGVPGLDARRLGGVKPVPNGAALDLAADAQPGRVACRARCNAPSLRIESGTEKYKLLPENPDNAVRHGALSGKACSTLDHSHVGRT